MTIEIIQEIIVNDLEGNPSSRAVIIAIDDTYEWPVGGLPLTGDLQPILDANEAQYLAAAQAANRLLDVFNVSQTEILKALALVIMDEINILRALHGLVARDESQIRTAIKNKLKEF